MNSLEIVTQRETEDGLTSLNFVNQNGELRCLAVCETPEIASVFKRALEIKDKLLKERLAKLHDASKEMETGTTTT